jgi:hypothetical protein
VNAPQVEARSARADTGFILAAAVARPAEKDPTMNTAAPRPSLHERIDRRATPLLAGVLALFVLCAVPLSAQARDHWHGHGGGVFFNFGWPGPYWGPRYYGPPVYYSPAPIIVERPPVYIERDDAQVTPAPSAAAAEPVWWYWCASSKKYYPYVQQCAGGFQRVPAQPMPAAPAN